MAQYEIAILVLDRSLESGARPAPPLGPSLCLCALCAVWVWRRAATGGLRLRRTLNPLVSRFCSLMVTGGLVEWGPLTATLRDLHRAVTLYDVLIADCCA